MRTPQEIQQMQDGVVGELLELRRRVKEQEQMLNRPAVRGEWEKTEGFDEYGGGRYVEWTCSVCFSKAKGGWAVRDKHIDEPPCWNYCPNCGADMREES